MTAIPLIGCLIAETFLTTLLQSNLSIIIARSGMTHHRVRWSQSYFWWFYYQMCLTHWFRLINLLLHIWLTIVLKVAHKSDCLTGIKKSFYELHDNMLALLLARICLSWLSWHKKSQKVPGNAFHNLCWLWYLMPREQRWCLFVFFSEGVVWVFHLSSGM